MRVIEEERDYYKKEYETLKAVKRSSSARATPTKVGLCVLCKSYHISSVIRQSFFSFQNNPKNLDLSYRTDQILGLFRKGKSQSKVSKDYLVICSNSRQGETLSYSRINMVQTKKNVWNNVVGENFHKSHLLKRLFLYIYFLMEILHPTKLWLYNLFKIIIDVDVDISRNTLAL